MLIDFFLKIKKDSTAFVTVRVEPSTAVKIPTDCTPPSKSDFESFCMLKTQYQHFRRLCQLIPEHLLKHLHK